MMLEREGQNGRGDIEKWKSLRFTSFVLVLACPLVVRSRSVLWQIVKGVDSYFLCICNEKKGLYTWDPTGSRVFQYINFLFLGLGERFFHQKVTH